MVSIQMLIKVDLSKLKFHQTVILDFEFVHQKSKKKEKWKCRRDFDLNPTRFTRKAVSTQRAFNLYSAYFGNESNIMWSQFLSWSKFNFLLTLFMTFSECKWIWSRQYSMNFRLIHWFYSLLIGMLNWMNGIHSLVELFPVELLLPEFQTDGFERLEFSLELRKAYVE